MKRRTTAALFSALLFPGAGQVFNKQFVKGFVLIVFTLFSLTLFVYFLIEGILSGLINPFPSAGFVENALLGIIGEGAKITCSLVILILLWAYSIADSYLFWDRR